MSNNEQQQNVSFLFEIRYITQNADERLAIAGSLSALGNWNHVDAILGKEIPRKSGRWLVAVELPENSLFEWKWLVISKNKTQVYRWEERPNRSLTSGTLPTHVRSVWNLGEEKEIPLKHKFQRLGSDDSDGEEEWSYLPSQDLFNTLCKEDSEETLITNQCINKPRESMNLGILDSFKDKNYGTENIREMNITAYSSLPSNQNGEAETCTGLEKTDDTQVDPCPTPKEENNELSQPTSSAHETGAEHDDQIPLVTQKSFIRRVGSTMCWLL